MESQDQKPHENWIAEMLIRLDARLQNVESNQTATLVQTTKTNGRLTELERDSIRKETEMKMVKGAMLVFIVPIFVSLAIWGLQNFISIAIK